MFGDGRSGVDFPPPALLAARLTITLRRLRS
jgi:hypothetical protein